MSGITETQSDLIIVVTTGNDITAYWDGYGTTLLQGHTGEGEFNVFAGLTVGPGCTFWLVEIPHRDTRYVCERLASGMHWAKLVEAQKEPAVMSW